MGAYSSGGGGGLTESDEQTLGNVDGATELSISSGTWIGLNIVMPSTEILYKITHMECATGTTNAGQAIIAAFAVDADPPVVANPNIVAQTEIFDNAADVSIKTACRSDLIRAGQNLMLLLNTSGTTQYKGTTSVASQNRRMTEAFNAGVPVGRIEAWVTATSLVTIKAYFRGYS